MKKIVLLFTLIVLQIGLFGCTSQEKKLEAAQEQSKTHRLTIVSSGKPSEVLPAFTTYTWSEEYNLVLSGVSGKSSDELQAYIRGEITTYLSTKGYEYRENPKQADVVIGFLFALENDVADETIQKKFGLLPGLARGNELDPRYEKGSLLLAVLDNEQKATYWRSAVQGFIDLEKDKSDDSENRMQKILGMMLGSFPQAGK